LWEFVALVDEWNAQNGGSAMSDGDVETAAALLDNAPNEVN
jgi:hypothetical protein